MNVLDFIGDRIHSADKIYIHPDIPRTKTANAINTYCHELNHDDILILVDDTVFGSAKNGMVITNNKIFSKEQMEKPLSFSFDSNTKFFVERKVMAVAVYINNIKLANTTQPSYKNLVDLFDNVNSFLKEKYPHEGIAPARTAAPTPAAVSAPSPAANATSTTTSTSTSTTAASVAPHSSYSLYRNLPDDGLMHRIRVEKGVGSFFDFFSTGDGRTGSEVIRKEVTGLLLKNIVHIRTEYIDKNNITGLKNNTATLELLLYSLALLRLEMSERYVNEDAINLVLLEGIKGFLDAGSSGREKNVINNLCSLSLSLGDDFDDVTTSFYLRLLSSNMNGRTVPENLDLDNLLDKFHNEEHLQGASSFEDVAGNVIGDILNQSLNELGDLSIDRKVTQYAQRCVDVILEKFR